MCELLPDVDGKKLDYRMSMPRQKPEISQQAKDRILEFIKAVEAIQEVFGVSIYADDGILALRDDRRTEEWITSEGDVYGQWDAQFFGTDTSHPAIVLADVEFEDFEGWDK